MALELVDQAEIEILVSELENRLDRLRALYDQYFTGIEKLLPTVPRKDVERRFYVLRREQIRNTGLRFRFNMLVQRFSTLSTYWMRITRQIENGTYKRDMMRAKKRFGEDALEPGVQVRGKALAERERAMARAAEAEANSPMSDAPPTSRDEDFGSLDHLEMPAPTTSSKKPKPSLAFDDFDDPFASGDPASSSSAPRPAPPSVGVPAPGSRTWPNPPTTRPSTEARPLTKMPPPLPGKAPPLPPRATKQAPPLPAAAKEQTNPNRQVSSFSKEATMPSTSIASLKGGAPEAARMPDPLSKRIVLPARKTAAGAPSEAAERSNPAFQRPQTSPSAITPAAPPSTPRTAAPPPPPTRRRTSSRPPAVAAVAAKPAPVVVPKPPSSGTRTGDALSDERVRQLYTQYVDAKRSRQESTAAITYDNLAKSLRESSARLKEKHSGKNVDFEVAEKDGKTILRPVVK